MTFPATDLTRSVEVSAATLSRDAWIRLGHWRDVERAEQFLALAHVAAGQGAEAIQCARRCQQLCAENQAPPHEFFFASEAFARGHALLDERATTDRHDGNCKTPRPRSSVDVPMSSPVNARATDGRTLLWQP